MPPLPVPKSRGGQAMPVVRTKKPRVPRVPTAPRAPVLTPDQIASQNAMTTFRTALAQMKASTPAVDSAAIYAPYRASEAVTGQLGQGLQTAVQNAGQAAQTQYATGRDLAQQHAAQFGISAGAGANPTAISDTGTPAIAEKTQAYATAAPQAAAAWQALLERTAGAKVADANLQRQNSLVSGEQQLSGQLPGLIGNEKQLAISQKAADANNSYLYATLDAKQRQAAQQYGLDVAGLKVKAGQAAASSDVANRRLAETERHDRATEKGAAARAKKASAAGIKGIPQVLQTLKIATPATSKVAKGWDVQVQATDPDTGDPLGAVTTIHVADARHLPAGYKAVGVPQTHYQTTPGKSQGLTLAQWQKAVGILQASNAGMTRQQAMKRLQQITPRPKK